MSIVVEKKASSVRVEFYFMSFMMRFMFLQTNNQVLNTIRTFDGTVDMVFTGLTISQDEGYIISYDWFNMGFTVL